MPDFLLEVGTEEIPDWMIDGALADLRGKFQAAFAGFGGDSLRTEATPRRLVLLAKNLSEKAADEQSIILGPYLSAGAKAAEGFARKNNTTVEALDKTVDGKGERYVASQMIRGLAAFDALRDRLPAIICGISFPKTMYWTGKGGVRFIRPIRWLVALLDERVVPFEVAGVTTGDSTRGHRILGSAQPLPVSIANYEETLRENFVLVRADDRRERITAALGTNVQHDPDLLDTLIYLTEYPSVIRGGFDASYLELPREILSTVMRHHQRYFSVVERGSLAPHFYAVTNTDGDPDGLIRQGNERVLRARFNDARFFWQVDQKKKLIDRVEELAKVTFQAKLGSYKDKTERVVVLGRTIAKQLGADAQTVERAARLAKCDLTTDMVKEFTELQGIVGGLYARAQGEGDAVSNAIYDHYKPVSMEDSIPRALEGQVLAIADKLDTLQRCFAIGLAPTGSKDPFALRRAAQGIVKILFEAGLELPLLDMVEDDEALVAFLRERIDFYLRDTRGFAYDEVNAVLATSVSSLRNLAERLEALHHVRPTGDFEPLAASFKRIKNILRQAREENPGKVNDQLLSDGPERDLYEALILVRERLNTSAEYRDKLAQIATLRPKVDSFFDKILVNDPNPAIRKNRLALLNSLLTEFSSIADFSEIVTAGTNA